MAKRFRAVETVVSLPTAELAIQEATKVIPRIVEKAVDGMVPQSDEAESPFGIFASKVPVHKQNRYLKMLLNDPVYYPARVAMEELAHWFEDPDGIFIRGLQGNEFNSRLFELYLQAAFYELDFKPMSQLLHGNPRRIIGWIIQEHLQVAILLMNGHF